MNKDKEKQSSLIKGANSAKTLLGRAKREVVVFAEHVKKFEQQLVIGCYSQSTLFNYSRSIASISLHFGKSPLELDPDEINAYLFSLTKRDTPSKTYWCASPIQTYGLWLAIFLSIV